MALPPPPPPPAEYEALLDEVVRRLPVDPPSHWKRHKGKYLIAAAAVVGLGVIGAAVAPDEEVEESAPATTEEAAVETTEAPAEPATTPAPAPAAPVTAPPPAPAEPSLAVLVEDLWVATSYCYTDCSNLNTAQEWIDRAEQYGRIDTGSFITGHEYLDVQPYADIDAVCDDFWVMADDEVAGMAIDAGIDPAAWVLNMYLWCDS